jgi:hypothetical protein
MIVSILAALPHRVGVPLGTPFTARSNKKLSYTILALSTIMSRDSSVGIATHYMLDGPEIESRWGGGFSAPVQTGHGAHPPSCTMDTGSFVGVQQPRRGANYPPPSSAEVKKKSTATHLLPFCDFMAGYRANFTFLSIVTEFHHDCTLLQINYMPHYAVQFVLNNLVFTYLIHSA